MELVERDASLLAFEHQLAVARLGAGHVLLVSGEASIGQTTLRRGVRQAGVNTRAEAVAAAARVGITPTE